MKKKMTKTQLYEELLICFLRERLYAKNKENFDLLIKDVCDILEKLYERKKKNVSTEHNFTGTILPTGGDYMGRHM